MAKAKKCLRCKQLCRALDQGHEGTAWICQNKQCKEFDEIVLESMP